MVSAQTIEIEIMVDPPGWLCSGRAWKAVIDCAHQIGTADGFRYDVMLIDSLTIPCFVARNEAGHEYDWYSVQAQSASICAASLKLRAVSTALAA
jgi:predicted deacetylase